MFLKVILFLLGFGLTTTGFVYIISYLNLLSFGYNFLEYVNFIIRRIECLNALFGVALMILSVTIGGKHELYLWYIFKL